MYKANEDYAAGLASRPHSRREPDGKFHAQQQTSLGVTMYRKTEMFDGAGIVPVAREVEVRKRRGAYFVKRSLDIFFALSFFVVMGWFFLFMWVLVSIKQGWPAIYRHKRIGLDGREFDCLKFRSMVKNSDRVLQEFLDSSPAAKQEWERDFKLRDDPRITPFGRFLRRSSLDELPQFWNVLRGDMSMVGPRPVVRKELEQYYGANAAAYKRVKPGITGSWQVSGRHIHGYDDRVALDVEYSKNWTVLGDLKIILKTVKVVLTADGAY